MPVLPADATPLLAPNQRPNKRHNHVQSKPPLYNTLQKCPIFGHASQLHRTKTKPINPKPLSLYLSSTHPRERYIFTPHAFIFSFTYVTIFKFRFPPYKLAYLLSKSDCFLCKCQHMHGHYKGRDNRQIQQNLSIGPY